MIAEDLLNQRTWHKLEQVICRQESRADERPLKFRWQGQWVQIQQVHSTWLERGPAENDCTHRVFKVLCDLGECQLRIRMDGWCWEFIRVPTRSAL